MIEFYPETPKHRADFPTYKTYNQYKTILREDFKRRCAYCCDLDKYKITNFAIDHYVPRNPDGCVSHISDNQYDNLIYSCSYCNRAKWNKWPTLDSNLDNDGVIGFIKPTNDEYKKLFYRTETGKIVPKHNNVLAKYIWEEIKLWLPIHSLMWRIERLIDLDSTIRIHLNKNRNEELEKIHYEITNEITLIYRDIFTHNE